MQLPAAMPAALGRRGFQHARREGDRRGVDGAAEGTASNFVRGRSRFDESIRIGGQSG